MSKSRKTAGGAPAWIVTFADLMSLLMTFFVLLLSFSTMEAEQFKKIAGALRESFGLQSITRLAGVVELDGTPSGTAPQHVVQIPIENIEIPLEPIGPGKGESPEGEDEPVPQTGIEAAQANARTFKELRTVMADEIASEVLDVVSTGNITIVRFPDRVSFPSGSGGLKPEFLPVLSKFLAVLEQSDGRIIISGHTDDIPISTEQYRSNWDLSAARAISVAHFILQHTNIQPERITVQGYADSRPLAPNDSAENRAKNRRVEITIQQQNEPDPVQPNQNNGEAGN